jgi:ectoine hydroxylase-related dioxygenase (phytanoyl-CoA dioxygenase family)
MLSREQKDQFHQAGFFHLRGAFSRAAARRMGDAIWGFLREKHGFSAGEPASWRIERPTGFQALTRSKVFEALAGSVLTDALNDLLGTAAWQVPKQWGAPLVTFPGRSSAWSVPHNQWHLDFLAQPPVEPLPGVRVFGLIAPVSRYGGATLVLSGSQRLVAGLVASGRAGHSTGARAALAAMDGWLRDLWSGGDPTDREQRFMREGATVGGVPLRVEPLTGNPGDIILMHPWVLHAPSSNSGTSPRMMVGHSIFRTGPVAQGEAARDVSRPGSNDPNPLTVPPAVKGLTHGWH